MIGATVPTCDLASRTFSTPFVCLAYSHPAHSHLINRTMSAQRVAANSDLTGVVLSFVGKQQFAFCAIDKSILKAYKQLYGSHTSLVAVTASVSRLQWASNAGCVLSSAVSAAAAGSSQLESLKALRALGCEWDDETYYEAAHSGHVDCLLYAHSNG
eukprot:1509-Heterococcus_DN1.PRE.1